MILLINGLYDICCSFGMLFFPNVPSLHSNMFINNKDPVVRRILAYWLMTYGMVRIAAGLYGGPVINIAAALTYFIEAFCFEYENTVGKTTIPSKVRFVSVFSLILGIHVLMYKVKPVLF